MSRGVTLNHVIELVTEDCCTCSVPFAIPKDLASRRREDHQSFWCPNGHAMNYTGKTKAQLATEELERVRKQLEYANSARQAWKDQAEAAERSRIALKGQLTKTRKRISNGVCPCCNRSFADLHRHMEGQHPDYVAVTEPEPGKV